MTRCERCDTESPTLPAKVATQYGTITIDLCQWCTLGLLRDVAHFFGEFDEERSGAIRRALDPRPSPALYTKAAEDITNEVRKFLNQRALPHPLALSSIYGKTAQDVERAITQRKEKESDT